MKWTNFLRRFGLLKIRLIICFNNRVYLMKRRIIFSIISLWCLIIMKKYLRKIVRVEELLFRTQESYCSDLWNKSHYSNYIMAGTGSAAAICLRQQCNRRGIHVSGPVVVNPSKQLIVQIPYQDALRPGDYVAMVRLEHHDATRFEFSIAGQQTGQANGTSLMSSDPVMFSRRIVFIVTHTILLGVTLSLGMIKNSKQT